MRAWLRSQPFLTRWRAVQHLRMPSSAWIASAGTCSEREEHARPTLKSQLRLLFKLIHPDLFHNQLLEQAINQNSFQLLQEYLDAAKGGKSYKRPSYHFVFFIRQEAAVENLKKVEVSLPPPHAQYFDEKKAAELPPSTRQSLAHLLKSCGLSDFDSSLDEERVRLSELFQQASEILRKNEASAVSFERLLNASKNALRVGRGIRVSLRPPLSDLSGESQVETLEKLAISLDRAQDVKLTGHNFIIGDCFGVDALGNIWLNYDEGIEGWSHFLNTFDLSKAAKNRKDATDRRVLEFKAAKALEVEMVFTHDRLGIQPEYTSFLNSIIKDALLHGAVGDGKFCKLPLRITCPERELKDDGINSAENDETSYMEVDETLGYIAIPVWESLPNMYKYIEQRGNEALQIRERLRHSEKHVDQVKLLVRRKLRLRELVFDKRLRIDMCLTACLRLIHYAPDLEMYMEGLAVCISDEHRLPVEGSKSYLHLKWNFSISEL
ncbi:hypothetical protein L7F22_048306 [Adiantum nelumboides]|nr:hypothetical protein [Adiantum nelumboides]